jgi:hypothetical protein
LVPVSRQEPNALAVAREQDAEAIVFYLVKPMRAGWDFGAARWPAGAKGNVDMAIDRRLLSREVQAIGYFSNCHCDLASYLTTGLSRKS